MYPGPVSSPEPVALFALLDRLTGVHHRWEYRDRLLRLRHRTWFLERPRELPLRMVRKWLEAFEREGALRWEDVVEARTTLTDAQRASLGEDRMERLGLPWDFGGQGTGSAPLLFEALTQEQRQRLRQGRALRMAEMTSRQQNLFLERLRQGNRYHLSVHLPPITISDWSAARFSLKRERLLRTREAQGGLIRYRHQPAPSPRTAPTPNPVSPPRARQPGASGTTRSPAAAEGSRPYLVHRLRFEFQYTPEWRLTEEITVAAPP
jgi:hypothetical protein